jgi:hypothetical protein
MKANELRIGNYVFDRYKITQVDKYFYQSAECFWTNEFKPIPLTEHWLFRFGFEKNIDYEQEINEYGKLSESNGRRGVGLYLHEGEWFVTFREDVGCGWCELNEIEYVHQLQNLYFALTNDELTIKS